MLIRCRVLPHADSDGPGNMAMDEALLDSVAEDPSAAALRTYGWIEPTLSLGYFQRVAEAEAEPRWRGVPLVRRPTGGGAIWHDRELTYALIVPRTHPLAATPADLYRAVHEAIAEVLRRRGVPAGRRGGDGDVGENQRHRPFLCFTDRDPEDIVSRGLKILGSAQRRRSGAVLQHGSLLLSRSPTAPELPGVGDLFGVATALPAWSDPLREAIPAALGLRAEDDEPSEVERRRASELAMRVYRDPRWTRRR
jgi:lipoate-protein ligase A